MAAPYLLKRRAGWYLRLRIPADLAPLLGSHLTRSLKTRDYGEARRRAVRAVARLHTCWQEAEGAMASHRLPPDGPLTADDYIRLGRQRLQARLVVGAADLRARLAAEVEAAIAGAVTPCEAGDAPADSRTAALTEARHLGRLEGLRDAMAALGSTPAPTSAPPAAAATSRPITDGRRESMAPWPSLIERFFAARPSVGESAAVSHRQAFSEFAALIGAKPIGRVNKGDVARYVEWLEGKANGRNGRARLARTTLVKKLQHIRSFFAWAEEKAYIAANPAVGVRPRTQSRQERADEGRRAFTEAELERLFASPLFTGCAGLRRRSTPGSVILRDERYWFFLAALLTGARIEELAEAPSALVMLGDVACLDLRVAATKTGNAPRLVPILPSLADLGFLAWAADKRAAGAAKLFRGGESCADWSKWTNRYLDAIGLDAPDTATYSLRHNFRQMLRAAGIGDELMNKVFGHAHQENGGNETGARYGRALSVQEARLVASRVLPPLSLVHLETCTSTGKG